MDIGINLAKNGFRSFSKLFLLSPRASCKCSSSVRFGRGELRSPGLAGPSHPAPAGFIPISKLPPALRNDNPSPQMGRFRIPMVAKDSSARRNSESVWAVKSGTSSWSLQRRTALPAGEDRPTTVTPKPRPAKPGGGSRRRARARGGHRHPLQPAALAALRAAGAYQLGTTSESKAFALREHIEAHRAPYPWHR